jgi:long-chain acyl-CoA synthetase
MLPFALTAVVRDPEAVAADFSSLRLCRVGADRVSPELHEEFRRLAGFFISEGYGMTEAGIVSLNPPSGEIRPGSVGLVAPGVHVRLVDDHGGDVPTGEVGRVLVQAPSLMTGYWSNPDATAAVISDGWLDSGDLARTDEDGYLWFSGRTKDIIVHDGSNVSPAEVETALAEHPAVNQAIVVGRLDPIHGENVHAFVTLVVGAVRPSERELIEFARERVGYRAPETIDVLDAVPLNPTGKVDRAALRDMITER